MKKTALLEAAAGQIAPAFVPTALGSLIGWWDFSDATKLFSDAGTTPIVADGTIYQANDKSGHSNHLIQASAGARPTYKTGIQNGLSVARFDGTTDAMATLAFAAELTQPYTVVTVHMNLGSPSDIPLMDGLDSSHRAHALYIASSKYAVFAGSAVRDSGVSIDTTDFHYTHTLMSGASTTLRVDGTPHSVTGDIGSHAMNGLLLGDDYVGLKFWNGDCGEVIVCSGALSAPDIASLDDYLSTKWGL